MTMPIYACLFAAAAAAAAAVTTATTTTTSRRIVDVISSRPTTSPLNRYHHNEYSTISRRRTGVPSLAFVGPNDHNIIPLSRIRRSTYDDVPRQQQQHHQQHDGRCRRPVEQRRRNSSIVRLFSSNNEQPHQYKIRRLDNVKIPLLDIMSTPALPNEPSLVVPLPSQHLPDPLRTCHTYGLQLQRPLYQMIVDAAVTSDGSNVPMSPDEQLAFMATGADSMIGNSGVDRNVFGQVLSKPNADSYVGAIGCTTQVLMNDFVKNDGGDRGGLDQQQRQIVLGDDDDAAGPNPDKEQQQQQRTKFVVCRGSFRFVVRDIVQTIPFPIAIVDELLDDDESSSSSSATSSEAENGLFEDVDGIGGFDEEDENDDDDDDMYTNLSPSQLIGRTLQATQTWLEQQLDKTSKPLTILEKSILEQSGVDPNLERQSIEEMVATFDVFRIELTDLFTTTNEQVFAVAFLVAEFINVENVARIQLVTMTDGVARLRRVLRHVETQVSETTARKLTEQVSSSTRSAPPPAETAGEDGGDNLNQQQDAASDDDDDASGGQQLTVGEPQLPQWTRQIGVGTQLEYFWNEEYEWCLCEVLAKQQITDYELLVTVKFVMDGTEHTLPINGDDKIRWRPPQQPPQE